MFKLRLLGGLTLEDEAGAHAGKAAQRRRLALLAVLDRAPRRTLTRDKLMALLWADEDADNARHRLSVVLHEIRKALGDDAVRSVGDDVTLNHEVVGSDVADFSAAFDSGDFERAVAHYDGPFLDGVFISGAPEFEHWVDSERDRWERAYRTALENIAQQHEAAGDWRGAAEVWRKVTLADTYNTTVALRYMNALSNAGEGGRALQFARVHELLIKEELKADVSPEFRAAVARLESGPPAAVPAPVVLPVSTPSPIAPIPETPLQEITASMSAASPPRRHPRFRRSQRTTAVSSVLIMLALFLVIALVIRTIRGGDGDAFGDVDGPIVVGILPFQNVGGDPRNDYLSDGLTEELIDALGKIEGLSVPSRSTIATYKGRNVDAVTAARELNAHYTMTGSVRRDGEDLRVYVELSDRKGLRVWGDSYDRRATDILFMQREIVKTSVDALRSRLPQRFAAKVAPSIDYTTSDPVAYDLYSQGRHALNSRSPNRLEMALAFFQQAIARDATYARAYAGIADVYNMLGAYNYGLRRPGEAYPRAREAAERALQLDSTLAEAHAALGNYLYNYEWKWEAAERELRTALKLNPGYTIGRHWLELVLLINEKRDAALEVVRKARESDPGSPLISSALAHHYYYRREFPKAIEEYKRAIAIDSTFLVARLGLGMSYSEIGDHAKAIEQGRAGLRLTGPNVPVTRSVLAYELARGGHRAEAEEMLRALERDAKRVYIAPHFLALVHLALGDEDAALTAMEAAYKERSGSMLYLLLEPPLDALRDQPRFKEIVKRVHGRAI